MLRPTTTSPSQALRAWRRVGHSRHQNRAYADHLKGTTRDNCRLARGTGGDDQGCSRARRAQVPVHTLWVYRPLYKRLESGAPGTLAALCSPPARQHCGLTRCAVSTGWLRGKSRRSLPLHGDAESVLGFDEMAMVVVADIDLDPVDGAGSVHGILPLDVRVSG